MHLVLSNLKFFWGEPSEEKVFLGEWCFLPEHLDLWYTTKVKIIESPWNDRKRFYKCAAEAEEFSDYLLDCLVKELNIISCSDNSKEYWRIVIGNWLSNYVGIIYNKYITLQNAIKKFPNVKGILLEEETEINYKIIDNAYHIHLFELQMYSKIFREINPNFKEISCGCYYKPHKYDEHILESNTKEALGQKKYSLKDVLIGWVTHNEQLIDEILNAAEIDYAKVAGLEKGCDNLFYGDQDIICRNRVKEIIYRNEFERIAIKLLPFYLPYSLFEGYRQFKDCILNRIEKLPNTFISGLGFQESLMARVLAAEIKSNGGKLIGIQHGSMYGIYKTLPCRKFEIEICDKYFSWGWGDTRSSKIVSLPSLASSYYLNRKKTTQKQKIKREKILFLANQIVPYFVDFRSAIKSHGSSKYLESQDIFFSSLPEEYYKKIIFRIKSPQQYKFWKKFLEKYKGIKVEGRDVKIEDTLKYTSIAISDCITQVYIDAMMNVPTILYWEDDIWGVDDNQKDSMLKLKEAKILWDNPLGAAKFLTKVYSSAESWWRSEKVQSAKNQFLLKYALPSENFKSEWIRMLKKECKYEQ